jgi:asparagine synthase (glutamine-hydrolysing)
MGFPTPLTEFAKNEARDYVRDVFSSRVALERGFIDNRAVLEGLEHEPQFGRAFWGFLSLELWQKAFHDADWKDIAMNHYISAQESR